MLYFSIALFTLGEILFIGVVDLLAITFAPAGKTGLYLGFSSCTWAVGGALASIIGSWAYDSLSAYHHISFFWVGIMILSVLLSFSLLVSRNKFVRILELVPQAV